MFGSVDATSYIYSKPQNNLNRNSSLTLSLLLHTPNQDTIPLREIIAVVDQLFGLRPMCRLVNCDSETEQ